MRLKAGFAVVLSVVALSLGPVPSPEPSHDLTLEDALLLSARGTPGEVTVAGLEGADVTSKAKKVSWEVVGSPPSAGGAGAGKATFGPLEITKNIDGNTLALASAAARGVHIPSVTITTFKPGTTQTLLTYLLEDVFVGEVAHRDATETVSFHYQRITLQRGSETFCFVLVAVAPC